MQQHQREQATHLGLVRQQRREHAPEPDRLRGQLAAAVVAGVEDQVDHREHGREPLRQRLLPGHGERDPGAADLRLGPRQPPLHRLGRDEERRRDLLGREPAERAQRQRHLRLARQRGMAAREQQLQAFVGDHRLLPHHGLREQRELRREHLLAPEPVDRAPPRHRHQPRARIARRAVARPALGGERERVLDGLLGELEVAEQADQRGQDAPPLVAEGALDQRRNPRTGRISTQPPMRAAGTWEASAIAASRSEASIT